MKDVLYHNPKIEIRKSPISGYGVFAIEDISENEILEEIPFLTIPMDPTESSSIFIDYRFPKSQCAVLIKLIVYEECLFILEVKIRNFIYLILKFK